MAGIAGARVVQIGRVAGALWVTSTGSRHAHLDGFDLHANVLVAPENRDGFEQLARYVLRPPIPQDRLTRTADGRVLLTLKAEWSDGTTHHEPRYRLGGCSGGSTAAKTVEVGRKPIETASRAKLSSRL